MKSKVKPKNSNKALPDLSHSIGDFIRYWGFRRVHGAIWTQLYLSETPLSCTDLSHNLSLSKALISPALEELCKYRLIHEVPAPNDKTKLYEASKDINGVIRHILKTREARILEQITENFLKVKKIELDTPSVNSDRLQSLEEMIFAANLMLQVLLSQRDLMKLPEEFKK